MLFALPLVDPNAVAHHFHDSVKFTVKKSGCIYLLINSHLSVLALWHCYWMSSLNLTSIPEFLPCSTLLRAEKWVLFLLASFHTHIAFLFLSAFIWPEFKWMPPNWHELQPRVEDHTLLCHFLVDFIICGKRLKLIDNFILFVDFIICHDNHYWN